jgi:hypothetical protein
MKTPMSVLNIYKKLDKIIFDYPVIKNHYLSKKEYQILFDYLLSKKAIKKESYDGFIMYREKMILAFNH